MTSKHNHSRNNGSLGLTAPYHFAILAINTGSTSTKIAVYHDDKEAVVCSLAHTTEQIARFATTEEHLGFTGRCEGISAHAVALIEGV